MVITLIENFRAVFYAPFYLPHVLGAYEAEGVDVALVSGQGTDYRAPVRAGSDGPVVYWGGPMRLMRAHDADPDSQLVGFCELVTRDPFYLVGAKPMTAFNFGALEGLRLGSVSEVPTPWLCLRDDLARAGVNIDGISRVSEATMAENVAALRDGALDVVQLFEPFVEDLVRAGTGHIWYTAASRGPCSYTAFYTTRAVATAYADMLARMTRAVYRCQKWLHAHEAGDVAAAVRDFFPDVDPEVLTAAIARYKGTGVWDRNPVLPRGGYQRLHDAMLSGGLIANPVDYEACTLRTFADMILAEDPPAMEAV